VTPLRRGRSNGRSGGSRGKRIRAKKGREEKNGEGSV